jgi:Uma2 family endonuclease
VIFSNFDVVEPDLMYMSNERASEVLRDWVHGAPELVIEIASASTRKRDETIKRRLYERFGVSEYWVADPDVERIRVYRRAGDSFARADELARETNDELSTPLLPGLALPLELIFKE